MLGLMLTRTHRRLLVEAKADYNERTTNLIVSQAREVQDIRRYYRARPWRCPRCGKNIARIGPKE